MQTPSVDWEIVRIAYQEFNVPKTQRDSYHDWDELETPLQVEEDAEPAESRLPFEDVLGSSDDVLGAARAWCERLGATSGSSPSGHGFVNGKHFDMNDVSFACSAYLLQKK
jgi:UDP-glucose:glycoprotein glucosyltransferase